MAVDFDFLDGVDEVAIATVTLDLPPADTLAPPQHGSPRVIALDQAEDRAGVWVLACSSMSACYGVPLLLHRLRDGGWQLPELRGASPWYGEARQRAGQAWEGWGSVLGVGVHGWAPAADTGDDGTVARPQRGWKSVTGVAAERFVAITVRSGSDQRTVDVHPVTGAFMALIRAPWSGRLEVSGVEASGRALPIDAV